MLSYNSLLAWNKTAFLCAGCVSECFGVGKPYRFFSQSTFKDLWIKCSVPSVSQTASWLGTEAGILRFSSELSILPQHTAVTLAPLVPIPWSVWGCGSEVLFDFFQSLPPPHQKTIWNPFLQKLVTSGLRLGVVLLWLTPTIWDSKMWLLLFYWRKGTACVIVLKISRARHAK